MFQGRYKAEMIEDESYYWTVSRYIHLNPVRAGLWCSPARTVGVVELPRLCRSGNGRHIRGVRPRRGACHSPRAQWGLWRGRPGRRLSCKYVKAGLRRCPSPFREAFGGWILGSTAFVASVTPAWPGPAVADPTCPPKRKALGHALDANDLCEAVVPLRTRTRRSGAPW